MKKDEIYLKHILDAILKIESFIGDKNPNIIFKNELVQSAVIRQLEIIGEAIKNLSADFRKKHKAIPWRDIAGTRDKLIHEYFGVDLVYVLNILKKDLPVLKKQIEKLI